MEDSSRPARDVSAVVDRSKTGTRLAALRAELRSRGMDGWLLPLTDEHHNEYVPLRAHRLAWLTGFTGSAGMAIVLQDRAAIFVDGRYTLQVRDQVDASLFAPHHSTDSPPGKWLAAQAPVGRLGYDPWLHTVDEVERLSAAVTAAGGTLVAEARNAVDAVWPDQPPPPT
jgi:Xaa-Pro aminopeptidase